MVQVGVKLALGVDLLREGGEGARGNGRAIDYGNDGIDGAGTADFRPLERLHQGLGQGQARGFDEDVIQVATALDQLAHHREEFFLDGAAQAAVGQLEDTTAGFLFGTADSALLEDFTVDTQLAEFVDDHGDTTALGVVEHVPQQGGLARAEKAGDDGNGKLGQCFHFDALGGWRACRTRTPVPGTRSHSPPDHPARL
ncbi:hypothetical protein D9M71_563510 [compost metagenome]